MKTVIASIIALSVLGASAASADVVGVRVGNHGVAVVDGHHHHMRHCSAWGWHHHHHDRYCRTWG